MADVFVSYRHSDHDVVAPLAAGLERRQIDVWFDREDIRSGDRWRERIAEGISEAGSVLVAVGPEGIGGVQAYEVDLALDRAVLDADLPIIPVLLPGARLEGRHWTQLAARSFVEMEGATDDDVVDRVANAVRGLDAPDLATVTGAGREPYPGLRQFTTEEADLYFGREADIGAMVDLCRVPGLAAVLGPSGSGKSSLVRAGLIPRLATTTIGGLRRWRPVIVDPGPEPTKSFLVGIMTSEDGALRLPRETIDQCLVDDGVFSTAVLTMFRVLDDRTGLLVVVDQLEQLFTACRDDTVRRAFGDNLASLAAHCPDRARVVVTLRSDYLDELAKLPALARTVGAHHHLLAPIDRDGLRDVIQRPAWATGVALEPRLVDEIALDVEDQPNALPLLSVALQEMWRQRQGDRLTLKAYAEGGRVTGALAELAEAAIRPLLPTHEALVRATLLRLVSFTPGAPAVRRRRRIDELAMTGDDGPIVHALISALTGSRLVVGGQDGVEYAHDAVVSTWPRLADWVVTARADEEARQRVESAAADWLSNHRSPTHLATAGMVAEVAPLVESGRLLLTPSEHDFVHESGRRLHRAMRRRWMMAATAVVAAVAVGLVGVLWRRTSEQGDQNREAVALRLAEQSVRAVTDRPDLGLQLAATAYGRSQQPAVRSALAATLTQPAPLVGTWSPIADPITAAAPVAGGHTLLLGTSERELLTCDAATRRCAPRGESPVPAPPAAIAAAGGSATVVLSDGTLLAGRLDGLLRDVAVGEPVRLASLDEQGALVAAATATGVVHLRNLAGGGGPIGQVAGTPSAIAVSARRNLVVGAGSDRFGFTLWTTDGRIVADVSSADVIGTVYAAAFDETASQLIVSDGSTGDVLVWPIDGLVTGEVESPLRLVGRSRSVTSITVTGDRLVTVDEGGIVRQLSLAVGRPVGAPMQALAPLGRPPARMMTAAYVADGERIVGVRRDAIVEWDALGRSPLLQGDVDIGGLVAVASSTDGSHVHALASTGTLVAVGVVDGGVDEPVTIDVPRPTALAALGPDRVAIGGAELAVVESQSGADKARRTDLDVAALAVDRPADPSTLAVATTGGDVLVLSAADLSTLAGPFPVTEERITDLALSPDGGTVVVGTTGGRTTDVLTLDTRAGELRSLPGHGAEVTGVAFSPDGALLATGSDDRSIILWSTDDWRPVTVLSGHDDRVWRLTFTPDGDMLLSASSDGTMRWWDVDSGAPMGLPLRWEGRRPLDVRAGAGVAIVQDGGTVSIWRTAPSAWVGLACSIAARPLTDVERATYLGRGEPGCPAG